MFSPRSVASPSRPIARRWAAIAVVAASLLALEAASPALALEPIRYRDDELAVDLGVGLWAWPMPMDWDGDGDFDLVISCTDVPQDGTYLFENPSGSGEKLPVFKTGVRVGPALKDAQVSYVDGHPRVLARMTEWVDFLGDRFEANERLPTSAKQPLDNEGLRARQWRYVDFDGDGDQDLVAAFEDWNDYGWDDGYDERGNWTRGPLHGTLYLLRNHGSDARPYYGFGRALHAGGKPIDTFGMPSPNFADFDGDGDLDLICGEFLDGFTYFPNLGTRKNPGYAEGVRLIAATGEPLTMDLQMITPTAIDWDRDGDMDLIVGDEDGRVALVEHTGALDGRRSPKFRKPVYFQQRADEVKFGALVTPCSADWDADGDEDLICGNTAGQIGWIENLDGGNPPRWAAPRLLEADGKTIRIEAGPNGSIQGPAEAKWGYTVLDVADWDGDGTLDLVVNSIFGRVEWYRGVRAESQSAGAPALAAAQPVEVAWPDGPRQPAWNWKPAGPTDLVTQWRTSPVVTDLNEDGLADLVMLDHEGYLAWFRRFRDESTGRLVLAPGERIFQNEKGEPLRLNAEDAGASGRRTFCLVDYDRDGKRDLILDDRNANFLKNVTPDDLQGVVRFQDLGTVSAKKLAGHSTRPTTVDWDRDGVRDLLIGAEDGRLYYQANPYAIPSPERTVGALTIRGVGFDWGSLDEGGVAFSNRDYTWQEVPEALRGFAFTRTGGGEPSTIEAQASEPTEIRVATTLEPERMLEAGWSDEGLEFAYSDAGRTRMKVYRRSIAAGERIFLPHGGWTGTLALLPLSGGPEPSEGRAAP